MRVRQKRSSRAAKPTWWRWRGRFWTTRAGSGTRQSASASRSITRRNTRAAIRRCGPAPRSRARASPAYFCSKVVSGVEADIRFVDAGRIAALGNGAQLRIHEPAQQRDALVARRQVLLRVQRDRALAGLRLVVSREFAVFGRGEFLPALAALPRADLLQRAALGDASRGVDAVVRIVDRQHPAERLDLLEARDARVRHDAQRRADRLGDPVMHSAVTEVAP